MEEGNKSHYFTFNSLKKLLVVGMPKFYLVIVELMESTRSFQQMTYAN